MEKTMKKTILLTGSPRGAKSTSEALGRYLLRGIEKHGPHETSTLRLTPTVWTEGGITALQAEIESADTVILSCPLYVDGLPATVVRAIEALAREKATVRPKKFAAIINSGFPEASQSETALSICRIFARESGFEWAGGLALGGGEALGGRDLEKTGWMGRNVRKALELSALALSDARPIPDEAVSLMARPLMPGRFYRLMGDIGWKRQAKINGVHKKMNSPPYLTKI